jgi:hypothetical protein
MPIQITARRDGFRRLGIAHSANTVTWPDDHFSDSELQILENDPNLIVVRLQDVPENAGDGDAVSALTTERDGLKARVSELEATVLQLNQDGDALKQQLASANGTITELETVRDALSQKLDALQAGSENRTKRPRGKPCTRTGRTWSGRLVSANACRSPTATTPGRLTMMC